MEDTLGAHRVSVLVGVVVVVVAVVQLDSGRGNLNLENAATRLAYGKACEVSS